MVPVYMRRTVVWNAAIPPLLIDTMRAFMLRQNAQVPVPQLVVSGDDMVMLRWYYQVEPATPSWFSLWRDNGEGWHLVVRVDTPSNLVTYRNDAAFAYLRFIRAQLHAPPAPRNGWHAYHPFLLRYVGGLRPHPCWPGEYSYDADA